MTVNAGTTSASLSPTSTRSAFFIELGLTTLMTHDPRRPPPAHPRLVPAGRRGHLAVSRMSVDCFVPRTADPTH